MNWVELEIAELTNELSVLKENKGGIEEIESIEKRIESLLAIA